jgi:hypothetical protein
MMTHSVRNMPNGQGDGGGLFVGRLETVESVKMETRAGQIVAIMVTTNQEQGCSTLQSLVFYAKSLATFVGGVSSGKSRSLQYFYCFTRLSRDYAH